MLCLGALPLLYNCAEPIAQKFALSFWLDDFVPLLKILELLLQVH